MARCFVARTLEGGRPAEGWIPGSPALRWASWNDRLDRSGSGMTASGTFRT